MSFASLARTASAIAGHPQTFIGAVALIGIWLACGPVFGFSDTWQLIINTGTTIVTFLMCFLIQSSQNHDTKALHTKLDELLCSIAAADSKLIALEDDDDQTIEAAKRDHEEHKL